MRDFCKKSRMGMAKLGFLRHSANAVTEEMQSIFEVRLVKKHENNSEWERRRLGFLSSATVCDNSMITEFVFLKSDHRL